MITTDLLPVSIIEDEGFLQLLKTIDPRYQPPSHRTIMKQLLPQLYENKKAVLMESLAQINWCSFTTDLWTSNNTMGYITMTCHYINSDWTLKSAVLETLHVPESHTSINLAATLLSITDQWQLSNKIHCAITDGASNIIGAIRNNKWNNLVCFAHRLNLVVSCAINEVPETKEIIERVKNVVSFFHKSSKATEKLRQMQVRLNLPEHKLIQQVITRWNSVYYMMTRYLEQHEAVRTALSLLERTDLAVPSDSNGYIEEMIRVLQPFEAVTTELSAEKYVSVSKILPLARGLQKVTMSNKNDGICLELSEKLLSQMSHRFSNFEDKAVVAVGTLLDPRFKKIPFASETSVDKMSRQIVSDATALANANEQHQPTPQPSSMSAATTAPSAVWEYFDSQVTSSATARRPNILAHSELGQYFKLPLLPRNEDPLIWWKQNSHVFPLISSVAKVYLSVIATSVPSERLFSKAGELISLKRNRLKPKNINMLLFLNKAK